MKHNLLLWLLGTAMPLLGFSQNEILTRGIELMAEQEAYTEALELFEDGLRDDPEWKEAQLGKAMALYYLDRNAEVLQLLTPWMEVSRSAKQMSWNPVTLMAQVYRALAMMDQEKYESGLTVFNVVRRATGDPSKTRAMLDACLVIAEDPHVYGLRSMLWEDEEKQVEELSRGLALDPDHEMMLNNRASGYIKLERYSEAYRDAHRAITNGDSSMYLFLNRGSSLYHLGEKRRALADYELALAEDSANVSPYLHKGDIYLEWRDFEAALACYEQAMPLIQEAEDPYVTYNNAGYCSLELGRWDDAIRYLNYAIQAVPDGPYPYNNRAFAHYHRGDYTAATRDIAKSLMLDPTNSWAYRNLGLVNLAQGDQEAACENYEKAIGLGHPPLDPDLQPLKEACRE